MEQTLQKLERWLKYFQKSILLFTGIETLIVIIIGIASNNITDKTYGHFWLTILIILAIIYISITIIRIAYNKTFPIAIVEELSAKEQLNKSLALVTRKDAINSYISNTIVALSNCECNIKRQVEDVDWKIDSDEDFINGITSLTSIFNNVLNILLNTTNFKFSTGIYVDYFRGFDHENHPQNNSGLFFMRDDYNLASAKFSRDLLTNNDFTGLELEVQNTIRVSLNNGKFLTKEIEVKEGKKILLICSNIQDLKNKDHQKGVLVIFTNTINELPEDIESVFRVFTNIISHWLDLYEHEVRSTQINYLTQDIDDDDDDIDDNRNNVGEETKETK